ncbi:hypothetical protein MED01_002423 [Micromonospora sp. MED01]|uniref:hypothetical protein n=1 Tax=Micromonospora alfalfae TaxID=2911212 RepID=UPI001EE785EB|nr:hypothetical protein [Micromonospora alfalfae]MCG5464258.1 hypothetical protein [Micromonospora alfalfae]
MTTSNLPAVRTSTALAVPQQRTAVAEPAQPAPLRLSTGLLFVSVIGAPLAVVSVAADRMEQAVLVGGAALGLLGVAFVERHREHRK